MKRIKPIKRAILFTATGEENLGDELILLCEIMQLQKRLPEANIAIFSHNPASTKRFLSHFEFGILNFELSEYFPNHLKKNPIKNILLFLKTLQILATSDHIFIGGGGLFYGKNEEGRSPLKLWKMRTNIARFFRKSVTFLSIGVSASIEELQPVAKGIFDGNTITVRDTFSQKILRECGFESTILPDPVFTFDASSLPVTSYQLSVTRGKKVGIALRHGFADSDNIKKTIVEFLSLGYEVILLPHSLHPTDECSHDGYYLQEFLLPGVTVAQTIEQTLEAYQSCSIILAMRLHSMILAIVFNIPFIALTYGQKTRVLCDELGWKHVYPANSFDADFIKSILQDIEKNRAELMKQLEKFYQQQQSFYTKNFPII